MGYFILLTKIFLFMFCGFSKGVLTHTPLKLCRRVQHLTATTCLNVNCPKVIYVQPNRRPQSIRYPVLNEPQVDKIRKIPGFLDENCMWLMSRLTDMQWINGVFGCVGQIGDNHLKIIGLLALNINDKVGEKMLITLENSQKNEKMNDIDSVFKNLGFLNYKLQKDSILNNTSNFESFRLISVNGWSDLNLLLRRMDQAACVLRDGGIISIDEVDSQDSPAFRAVEYFLSKHGSSVFTPLIHIRNRLFLTTTNYFNNYYRFFIENRHLLLAYGLREASSTRFGARYSYFIAAD